MVIAWDLTGCFTARGVHGHVAFAASISSSLCEQASSSGAKVQKRLSRMCFAKLGKTLHVTSENFGRAFDSFVPLKRSLSCRFGPSISLHALDRRAKLTALGSNHHGCRRPRFLCARWHRLKHSFRCAPATWAACADSCHALRVVCTTGKIAAVAPHVQSDCLQIQCCGMCGGCSPAATLLARCSRRTVPVRDALHSACIVAGRCFVTPHRPARAFLACCH